MAISDAGMFTVKEINRLKILQDVIDRNLRPGKAAEMLGITPRHCSRLLKRYRQSGPFGMNNQSRGRTGNRLLPRSLTDQALSIIRERYRDFGPTLARENIVEEPSASILMSGIILTGIRNCDYMVCYCPTPPMTVFLKLIPSQLWITIFSEQEFVAMRQVSDSRPKCTCSSFF
ncbi:helix-turn-helix domain-containing protein [Shigella dysenteriae]|nr:helix-turn-helix domain-containing protein [Shigella dysenteriae]MDS1496927.1 helix-turn-helix domain-containing protein [Shigella dysenteriae]